LTVFASRNSNEAYAPDDVVFTAIPEFTRYVFNPKLFLYFNDRTSLNFGINSSIETRTGGDLQYIKGKGDATNRFFERNESDRVSNQFALNHKIGDHSEINVRNSLSYFNRRIIVPDYIFDGNQYGSFSEATYSTWNETVEWIGGLNLWTDRLKEEKNGQTMTPLRNYDQ